MVENWPAELLEDSVDSSHTVEPSVVGIDLLDLQPFHLGEVNPIEELQTGVRSLHFSGSQFITISGLRFLKGWVGFNRL